MIAIALLEQVAKQAEVCLYVLEPQGGRPELPLRKIFVGPDCVSALVLSPQFLVLERVVLDGGFEWQVWEHATGERFCWAGESVDGSLEALLSVEAQDYLEILEEILCKADDGSNVDELEQEEVPSGGAHTGFVSAQGS